MAGLFDEEPFRFYSGDERLAARLGLDDRSRWRGEDKRDGIVLGTTTVGDAEIEVEVAAWPAQFWGFTIRRYGVDELVLSTGSGGLSDYWPHVERLARTGVIDAEHERLVADDMLGVKDLRPPIAVKALGDRSRLSPLADRSSGS